MNIIKGQAFCLSFLFSSNAAARVLVFNIDPLLFLVAFKNFLAENHLVQAVFKRSVLAFEVFIPDTAVNLLKALFKRVGEALQMS